MLSSYRMQASARLTYKSSSSSRYNVIDACLLKFGMRNNYQMQQAGKSYKEATTSLLYECFFEILTYVGSCSARVLLSYVG